MSQRSQAISNRLPRINAQYSERYREQTNVARVTLRNRKPVDVEHLVGLREKGVSQAFRHFSLYRMWNADGQLLYIGLSSSIQVRFKNLRHYGSWLSEVARIEVEPLPLGQQAFSIETAAIAAEKPKYNLNRGGSRYHRQMAAVARQAALERLRSDGQ